eukprot:9500483-Pyramimonas_sp.AAC.2
MHGDQFRDRGICRGAFGSVSLLLSPYAMPTANSPNSTPIKRALASHPAGAPMLTAAEEGQHPQRETAAYPARLRAPVRAQEADCGVG